MIWFISILFSTVSEIRLKVLSIPLCSLESNQNSERLQKAEAHMSTD